MCICFVRVCDCVCMCACVCVFTSFREGLTATRFGKGSALGVMEYPSKPVGYVLVLSFRSITFSFVDLCLKVAHD